MSGLMNIFRIAVATLLVTTCVSDAESLFKSGRVSSQQRELVPEQIPYKSGEGVKDTSEKSYSYSEESTNAILDLAVSNLLLDAGRIDSQQRELAPEGILSESDEGDGIASDEQASNEPLYTNFDLVSYLRHTFTIEESFVVPIDDYIPVVPAEFICRIMERIVAIFRNRLPPTAGNQFAVLAIVPESVQDPSDIDFFLEPEHINVNYRFTTPTRFPNQNCRTHAEIIAMQGTPHEGFNLIQFYNNFIDANPGDAPRFAVLYTWIYPCRACADQIAANFGEGSQWPIPTFVGRTTQGNRIHPPLTDQDRVQIEQILVLAFIQLFHIRQSSISVLASKLDNQTNTMFGRFEDNLCDSCYLNSKGLDNEFNCEDTGPSSPDSCPTDVAPHSVEIDQLNGNNGTVAMKADEPCCKPGPTELFRAAKGQKCKSTSPCGYSGESYVWCYLEDGGWEYCCTGECGNHGNTGYDWCTSGSTWQSCHRDPTRFDRTATLELCRSDHKCGFHGEDYTWCYKQSGSWDYCCTSNCEQYGESYDWCSAGSEWQYCKRDLPREYSSALLKQCKSESPCGYQGYDYAWCYTNDGSWDYCCTGDCGPHGYGYDWCTSGKKWSSCKMKTISSARYTYNLKTCDLSSNCGYHGYDYAWCYTTDESWDYCCTETCGLNGEMYDWCTTSIKNYWKYCKREELPESRITVTGESCRSDHSCGYHGYDYSWCYTASNWDYCCSSSCGKYNTDSDFCAAGNTHAACCCSEY